MGVLRDFFDTSGFLETADDTWAEIIGVTVPTDSAMGCDVRACCRRPSDGEVIAFFEAGVVSRTGTDDPVVRVQLTPLKGKLSDNILLDGCNVRLKAHGAQIAVEVRGLAGSALHWAASLKTEIVQTTP